MPATPLLPKIPEHLFQDKVIEYAKIQGWWVYHTHDSRHSQKGFPDLVLIRPPRLVLAELKGTGGRLTPDQVVVLGMLKQCPGQEVHTWWPHDWDDVKLILARPRPTR